MTETLESPRLTEHPIRPSMGSSSRSSASVPPELLADAGRRLGWVALIDVGGTGVGHFGRRAALALTSASGFGVHLSDIVALAAAALGTAVYLVARGQRLSPGRVLDLGLFFQVAGAFGIAAGELLDGALPAVDRLFAFVPVECIWIVLFPLVVPNTPMRVLVASLLAASMGPAALGLSAAVHGTPIDRPFVVAAFYLTSNYLCAVIAYLVARIVHRFNMRLKHLREIGSYELIERIGEGGMGEVWLARHCLLARAAASKLIQSELLGAS